MRSQRVRRLGRVEIVFELHEGHFGGLRSAYSGKNSRRASPAMRRAASSFLCFDDCRGLPLRSMGTRMCSTSAKKYLASARRAQSAFDPSRVRPAKNIVAFQAVWHESVCARFWADQQLIAVAGQVCRGKSACGRFSSAAQTRFPARSPTAAAILFRWRTWNSFDADDQRKRSATASSCWPRCHRWLASHAAVQKLQARAEGAYEISGRCRPIAAYDSADEASPNGGHERRRFSLVRRCRAQPCPVSTLCVWGAPCRVRYFVGRDTNRSDCISSACKASFGTPIAAATIERCCEMPTSRSSCDGLDSFKSVP